MASLPTLFTFLVATFQLTLVLSTTAPMSLKYRKSLMKLLLESPVFAKIIYALKISSLFILVLLVDAGNTIVRLQFRRRQYETIAGDQLDGGDIGTPASMDRTARILLAQRNLALTATTLFLSYLLWRVFEMNLSIIRLEEKLGLAEGRDLGTPINESREAFKELQAAQAPDFKLQAASGATIRRRSVAVHNKEVPENDVVPAEVEAETTEAVKVE